MANVIPSETNGITSEVTLLPCPWCGKADKLKMHARKTRHYDKPLQSVMCARCGTRGRYQLTEERAVTTWNTRPLDAATAEMAKRIQSLELECAKLAEELRKAENRGKLTAEQVRECAERVYLEGYSDGSVSRGAHIEETDWQAIADELNAALGVGECELVYGENDYGDDGWWCQSCGKWFAASFRHTGRNNIIKPRYCQQCGKAVKR